MQIYIVKAGQQTGPYDKDQLESLVRDGEISIKDLAWHRGMPDWVPLHRVPGLPFFRHGDPATDAEAHSPYESPESDDDDGAYRHFPSHDPAAAPELIFLHIPIHRLLIMSILTLGTYDKYWMYRNWTLIRDRDGSSIIPLARAVLGIIFIYPLLRRMRDDPAANSILPMTIPAGLLATGWLLVAFISTTTQRSEHAVPILAGFVISFSSSFFLIPAQYMVNRMNKRNGVRRPYYGFSFGHVVCLVYGLLTWYFLIQEWIGEAPVVP